MRGDDRDDPFGDIFDEIERMMNEMTGAGTGAVADGSGFSGSSSSVMRTFSSRSTSPAPRERMASIAAPP